MNLRKASASGRVFSIVLSPLPVRIVAADMLSAQNLLFHLYYLKAP
jgi:hypothetical protein